VTRNREVLVECSACSRGAERVLVERFREQGFIPGQPAWWPTRSQRAEVYPDGTVNMAGDNSTGDLLQSGRGRYRWTLRCPRCGAGSPVRANRADDVLYGVVTTAAEFGVAKDPVVDVLWFVDQVKRVRRG